MRNHGKLLFLAILSTLNTARTTAAFAQRSGDAASRSIQTTALQSMAQAWTGPRQRLFVLDTTVRVVPLADAVTWMVSDSVHGVPADWQPAAKALLALDSAPAVSVPRVRGMTLVHSVPLDTTIGPPPAPVCVVLRVSRVGVDPSRQRAAVYVDMQCNDTGDGQLLFFMYTEGVWRQMDSRNLWSAL